MKRITTPEPDDIKNVDQVSQQQVNEQLAAPTSRVPRQDEQRRLLPPELMTILTPSLKVGATFGMFT